MKQRDLVKRIRATGSLFVRHGSKHDWYRNPKTGVYQAVPRHREVDERLAKNIIRELSTPGN